MMDPVKFSNEQARPVADLLAQAYLRCSDVVARWNALGGGQTAINAMEADIRAAANAVLAAYAHAFLDEKLWFLGYNVATPNTTAALGDGSPDDGRPAATGQKVYAVMDRAVQVQNWLFSAAVSFTDTARNNAAPYNTVLMVSGKGPSPMAVSDAGNFVNRCTELKTNYEAADNTNLGTLLALAVNPNPVTS